MLSTKTAALCAVTAATIMGAGQVAHATVITQGFETTSGYTLDTDGGASLTRSTDVAHSGTHSAKFSFPQQPASGDYAKVVQNIAPGQLQLGSSVGTFWTYVPRASHNQDWIPYMYYWVDTDQNGTLDFGGANQDSLVIAFLGVTYNANHVTADTWMQSGLDSSTSIHVVGNRTGLGSAFTTAGGPHGDTLGLLSGTPLGGGLNWGDLDILQARVGTGANDTSLGGYIAYVDDMRVSGVKVPEPSGLAMFALGLGGLLLLGWRRRRVG